MKKLYIVIRDCGDASQTLDFTFDEALITLMCERESDLDDCYQSGDGLQIRELNVPEEVTYETLGISEWSVLTNPFEK